MSSQWQRTEIPGLFRTGRLPLFDERGSFTKILGEGDEATENAFGVKEIFWSNSTRGTFRGLHVPLPPHATRKLVFVTHGVVRDFVLDLRRGSPTHRRLWETELDATGGGLVIPDGCAHGFEVVSDSASMVYAQEQFHSAASDGGILYSSVGVVLVDDSPTISPRDRSLPPLAEFDNPFVFT